MSLSEGNQNFMRVECESILVVDEIYFIAEHYVGLFLLRSV